MIQEGNMADMTPLSEVLIIAGERGFTEEFKATTDGLFAPSNNIHYLPNEVKIDNFYRFEGASDPDDSAILYLLETHDGLKGILIDIYGPGADDKIAAFINKIPEIPKTPENDDFSNPDWQ